ncbi:hypothetical protein PG987_015420 [Apiospora arundinis]
MPPKQASANEETASVPLSDLKTVLYAISTSNEYSLNTAALAKALGMSGPKNVPRKIRSVIEPYGFELKDNRIVVKGQDTSTPDTANGSSSAPVTPAKGKKGGAKTPKSGAQQSASKKRKISDDNNEPAEEPVEEPVGEVKDEEESKTVDMDEA